jgi:hypothetical protein
MLISNKKTAIAFVVVQTAGMMLLVSSDTAEVKMEDIFSSPLDVTRVRNMCT